MISKTKKPTRVRLNLRIPKPLLEWARHYAQCWSTTVTQLVIDGLIKEQKLNEKLKKKRMKKEEASA
jgi:hypothetical protein